MDIERPRTKSKGHSEFTQRLANLQALISNYTKQLPYRRVFNDLVDQEVLTDNIVERFNHDGRKVTYVVFLNYWNLTKSGYNDVTHFIRSIRTQLTTKLETATEVWVTRADNRDNEVGAHPQSLKVKIPLNVEVTYEI